MRIPLAGHGPVAALDPLDRVYADIAERAAQGAEGTSIHSPLFLAPPGLLDDLPSIVMSPTLRVVIMSVASDDTVFVSAWSGDRDQLFTSRVSETGVLLSHPADLDQICQLVGEQVAGSWLALETSIAPLIVTFVALKLDGDHVVAGFHKTFEPDQDGDRGSPDEIARLLSAGSEALSSTHEDESILLAPGGADVDGDETWEIEAGREDGDAALIERVQELRATSVVEISVDLDGELTLVATGRGGTAVVTELDAARVCVRESRRGALAEVIDVCHAGGFGERAASGGATQLAELFRGPEDGPAPVPDDPRELVVTVVVDLGEGSPTLARLLFVESSDGCYFVEEPYNLGQDDQPLDLPLTPASRRDIMGRVAASLRLESPAAQPAG